MKEILRGLGIEEVILEGDDKLKVLRIFADKIKDCKKCRLYTGRKQVVVGSGNP